MKLQLQLESNFILPSSLVGKLSYTVCKHITRIIFRAYLSADERNTAKQSLNVVCPLLIATCDLCSRSGVFMVGYNTYRCNAYKVGNGNICITSYTKACSDFERNKFGNETVTQQQQVIYIIFVTVRGDSHVASKTVRKTRAAPFL